MRGINVDLAKLGIEDRRVRIDEETAGVFVDAVRAILADLELTPAQQARVSEIVPRHLRAIEGGAGA
jgi:methyl coenzyme M reductase subunit C